MKESINRKNARIKAIRRSRMRGFSLIEVVIVLVIISILTAISLPYVYNYKKLYKSEDQALIIMDLMREASQLALTKRRIARLEIDLTDNKILIIDGNGTGTADDLEIKAIPLEDVSEIRMDQIPTGVSKPNPPNYNDAAFVTDSIGHKFGNSTVTGHQVWQVAFLRDGSAVNPNTNVPLSANLYIWAPVTSGSTVPRSNGEVRAITIFGGSGAIRYWKHDGTTFLPY